MAVDQQHEVTIYTNDAQRVATSRLKGYSRPKMAMIMIYEIEIEKTKARQIKEHQQCRRHDSRIDSGVIVANH